MKQRITSLVLCAAICLGSTVPALSVPVAAASQPCVEQLDRGIIATKTAGGMLVSWRFLANDPDDAAFRLYRGSELVYSGDSDDATCFLDAAGSISDIYRVECVSGGRTVSSDVCRMMSGESYFKISLDPPSGSYVPLESTIGDADGDGQMEFFLKWEPSNAKDNSQKGKTDDVFIDCIKLDGTRLWRIDLGKNIRAGNHYTQMLVADYDSDGFAELCCKTADGTKDGNGKIIGDGSKDYRNSSGYVLDGPEYYSLFDGRTGAVLDTVNYEPARGTVSSWGDKYGNRVDRLHIPFRMHRLPGRCMEQNYSIKTGRENTAITGFSMGGRESLYIGFSRPDLFGYIGAMCPAPGVPLQKSQYTFKQDELPYLLHVSAGSNDTLIYSTPEGYHNTMTEVGTDHIWHYVQGGDHGGKTIRPHMYFFVREVFKA